MLVREPGASGYPGVPTQWVPSPKLPGRAARSRGRTFIGEFQSIHGIQSGTYFGYQDASAALTTGRYRDNEITARSASSGKARPSALRLTSCFRTHVPNFLTDAREIILLIEEPTLPPLTDSSNGGGNQEDQRD